MDREQVEKWATKAARSDHSRLLGCGMDDLTRFAVIARNAALEEAKADLYDMEQMYLRDGNRHKANTARSAANRISALIEKEPQP